MKHAPGPWEVGSTIESGTQAIIHDGDSVLAILPTIPPNPANARLIAAAPDLLEALKDCADRLEIHMKHSEDLVAHMKAIAAIAKARG